ncbi:hypothetical protein T190611E02C_50165 [Tenacibaculum sp. 190524A05c]|uniref:hypothetical protein n=1 Tax=Tenacibaculum platacis TaxID=3137852 RepID=UPI0031FA4F2A
MKITTKINVGKDKLIFKNINNAEELLQNELSIYREYDIGSILIEHNSKRFFIYQMDIEEIFYGLFLEKITSILNVEPISSGKIEVSPCGQEKIKYVIDNIHDNANIILKYEPSVYDELEEDDYYVTNGYDIEIVLPREQFLESIYKSIKEYILFMIKYSDKKWTIKGINYNNNLFEKVEKALTEFGIPFESFRIAQEMIKDLKDGKGF